MLVSKSYFVQYVWSKKLKTNLICQILVQFSRRFLGTKKFVCLKNFDANKVNIQHEKALSEPELLHLKGFTKTLSSTPAYFY